jgi:osmoprotectant transport system permease protein
MGFTPWQVLTRVELPCALPFALAGLRSAANQVLATATIAGFRGLGGMGRYIFSGFGTQRYDVVYGATIAIIALILVVELAFVGIQRLVVSPGVRQSWRTRPAVELSPTAVPSITPALTPPSLGGSPP